MRYSFAQDAPGKGADSADNQACRYRQTTKHTPLHSAAVQTDYFCQETNADKKQTGRAKRTNTCHTRQACRTKPIFRPIPACSSALRGSKNPATARDRATNTLERRSFLRYSQWHPAPLIL